MKTSIHIENKIRPKASRNGLKYHIKTFGCQMNEHDSEKIAGIFNNDGMTKSDDIDNADVLFVNTCTIRENADDKLFNKIIDINVKAAFKLSNMVMKYMKENNSGSIINISSVEGHKPDKGLGIYSISKAAISMLTKSQAKEWGKYGIRSNAICPGLIKTKLSSALWQNEEMLEIWLKDLPIRKAAEPEEISGMAVYLASNASSYTTGETFNIDGGYMIN